MRNSSLVMMVCRKESKGTSPVKFEVFDFYAKLCNKEDEKQWKDLFHIMSRGNIQKGIKFNGKILTVKNGNSVHTYEVTIPESMEIDEATEEDFYNLKKCKKFIKKYSSVFLENETENVKKFDKNSNDEGTENKFTLGIVNQTTSIRKFAVKKCREFCLSEDVCDSLSSTINSLFATKKLNSKSVLQNRSDGEINSIKGIVINENGFFIVTSYLQDGKGTDNTGKKKKGLIFGSSLFLSKVEQKIAKN